MSPPTEPGTRWWIGRTCSECGKWFIVGKVNADHVQREAIDAVLEVAEPKPARERNGDTHECLGAFEWEWRANPGSSARQHWPGPAAPEGA